MSKTSGHQAASFQGMTAPEPARVLQADKLEVRIYASLEEMATAAAVEAGAYLAERCGRAGGMAAVLATGNSQISFLEALMGLGGLDWGRATLFHMDEYLGLSGDHAASFRRYMRERVEAKVRPGRFHYLNGEALEPIEECERYENLLRAQELDLCCLGIGENGHLAFNDPPVARFDDRRGVKLVKLDEGCRQQQHGEGHFPSVEAVPQYALTLTIPELCRARRMICICPEERKAKAVRAAVRDEVSTKCPASFLRTQDHAVLYLDSGSASLL